VVRTSIGAIVTACALSAAALVSGCGDAGNKGTASSAEVLLEPAVAKGPDPFTGSTVSATGAASPGPRMPQSALSGRTGPQHLSGGMPGLYGGTRGAGSCDVRRQIEHLTSDQVRGRVFAEVSGIGQASIPGYLRGLTSVVLRADTRVTNHGFRDGRGIGYQSVLQAGTAVLVDSHGVPRVRCACGNPLAPAADDLPSGAGGAANPGTSGRPWSGYRPDRVVVVAPTPQVIADITIINVVDNTWIERPVGHRGQDRDHVLPRPQPVTPTPVPDPSYPDDSASPGERSSPEGSPTDCVTPKAPAVPGAAEDSLTEIASGTSDASGRSGTSDASDASGCPSAPGTEPQPHPKSPDAPRSPDAPDSPATSDSPAASDPPATSESPEKTGPETVPESPDLPDGGGLIPDEPRTTDSVFGSPTDVFDG
jgi:hypothetical protein